MQSLCWQAANKLMQWWNHQLQRAQNSLSCAPLTMGRKNVTLNHITLQRPSQNVMIIEHQKKQPPCLLSSIYQQLFVQLRFCQLFTFCLSVYYTKVQPNDMAISVEARAECIPANTMIFLYPPCIVNCLWSHCVFFWFSCTNCMHFAV